MRVSSTAVSMTKVTSAGMITQRVLARCKQVVKLHDLSAKQKQRMYLRFTKELFILHQLQHARIVPVYACSSTLDELTLIMKVTTSQ
jgi:hypothetical protein